MKLYGKKWLDSALRPLKRSLRRQPAQVKSLIPEIAPSEQSLIQRYANFTMTSVERQWALISAVKYLNAAAIEGDIVECGVWRGGNMLLAKDLCRASPIDRKFFLFDTFTGMSEPTDDDVSHGAVPAKNEFEVRRQEDYTDWACASIEDVRQNFERAQLLDESIVFVKGKVEDTLTDERNLPQRIALLRLDTDWYESTKAELEILYPMLVSGGVMIIDDYGHWAGARKAVDEYFHGQPILLSRIDYTARMMVRR